MSNADKTVIQNKSDSSRIPNINIGKAYDQHYVDADIHYERLENLADFFGRNMPVHYHDRFYQIHVVLNGTVRVHLDETSYSAKGPMFFFTPPTIPHAFVTDNNAIGHVITIKQQIVWELMQDLVSTGFSSQSSLNLPICVALKPCEEIEAAKILDLLSMLEKETTHSAVDNVVASKALMQLILLSVYRLADQKQPQQKTRKEDVRIFHLFNELVEKHYTEHLKLSEYAQMINVTEARLSEVCRRLSGLSSKKVLSERLMQEARRLLTFSSAPMIEISFQLGFKDPAYFARFFRNNQGLTASEFREMKQC